MVGNSGIKQDRNSFTSVKDTSLTRLEYERDQAKKQKDGRIKKLSEQSKEIQQQKKSAVEISEIKDQTESCENREIPGFMSFDSILKGSICGTNKIKQKLTEEKENALNESVRVTEILKLKEQERERTTDEVSVLTKQLTGIEEEKNIAVRDAATAREQLIALQNDMKNTDTEATKLRVQLNQVNRELDERIEEVSQEAQRSKDLRRVLNLIRHELSKIQSQVNELNEWSLSVHKEHSPLSDTVGDQLNCCDKL